MKWMFLGVLACVAACASSPSDKGGQRFPLKIPEFRNVAHSDQLRGALIVAITALRECATIECYARAGFTLVRMEDTDRPRRERVREIRPMVDSPTMVHLELIPEGARDRGDSWIMVAHYVENQWHFSWPEGVGPPLH